MYTDILNGITTRGDQKVLQLPTLVNKMAKINGWMRISEYLVINFKKNDDSFFVYDVIMTSL